MSGADHYQRAVREGSPLQEGWRALLEARGLDADHIAWLGRCARQGDAQFVTECRRANERDALARVIGTWPVQSAELLRERSTA